MTPTWRSLYGEHFILPKEGQVRVLEHGQASWDVEFLESFYDVRLTSIPFGGRAFIVRLIR